MTHQRRTRGGSVVSLTRRPSPVPEVFQLTCGLDGRAHLATVSQVEIDIVSGRGYFTALCGHDIAAAALGTPPGTECLNCRRLPHRPPKESRS